MMRLCIIGASGHYRYVLDGLDARISLRGHAPGSADEDDSKLNTLLRGQNLEVQRFDDWRYMLDVVQPEIVAVNCHFGDHARISMECLARGIHVFSEKPVATTLPDLEALQRAHQHSGKHFAAMFGIRCKPWFLAAQAAVAAGRIGEVRLMHAQKSYKLGQRPAFFARRASSGGLIPWVGSHAIDWLQWFSGQPFLSVTAQHSRLHNAGNGELEVAAQALFTLHNEVSATVSIDYLRPASAPSHDDDRLRIVGTGGIVEVRDRQAVLLNHDSDIVQALPALPEQSIFAGFVDQVLGTGSCVVSSEESFNATRASLLAREAADTGQTLRF